MEHEAIDELSDEVTALQHSVEVLSTFGDKHRANLERHFRSGNTLRFLHFYGANPVTRIAVTREGLPSSFLVGLADSMGSSTTALSQILRVARSTLQRRLKANDTMSVDESERVMGFAKILGQVEHMVTTSGNPDGFDASHWLANWIEQPLPALGNDPPKKYLDTGEGQKMVSDILAQMASGAFA